MLTIQAQSGRGRGFTLLELIVVLAIAGMLAGVVALGIGRGSQTRDQRNAITHLASELQLARVEAMKHGEAVGVTIRATETALECDYADLSRRFTCSGLVISQIDNEPTPLHEPDEGMMGRVEVVFEPDGRTRRRMIAFASGGGSDTLLPRIEFDPISGAIELGRAMDPSPRDQGGADR